jgi:hypothetical protein
MSISSKFKVKTGYIRLTNIELVSLWQASSNTRDFAKRFYSLQKEYVIQDQEEAPSSWRSYDRFIEVYEWQLRRFEEDKCLSAKRFIEFYSNAGPHGYQIWRARGYNFSSLESHRSRVRDLKRNGVTSLKRLRTVREKSPSPDYAALNNHAANLSTS